MRISSTLKKGGYILLLLFPLFTQAQTPVLKSSVSDHLTDGNSNNIANPGEVLTYRDTIRNTGSTNAGSVQVTHQNSGTKYKAGSLKTSALAADDSYLTGTNTNLSVTAAAGTLANDFGQPTIIVTSFSKTDNSGTITVNSAGSTGTTDNGGTLIMYPDGSFQYTPLNNFSGIDKFKYTATTSTGLPDNDAVVSISIVTPATAGDDSYPVTGNISISRPSTSGILSNDLGSGTKTIKTLNGSAFVPGATILTSNGGSLTVASDGSFTYNPPAGFIGTDLCNYTVDNELNQPSSGTISFPVSNMIWFVNSSLSSSGDGRLSSPFNSLSAIAAAPTDNNHVIFLFESATSYIGPVNLKQGQRLIGQDATSPLSALAGFTIATGSAALPTMNTTNTQSKITSANTETTVSLSIDNQIHGLTLGSAGANHLAGNGFGNLTIKDVIINGTGSAMALSNGNFVSGSSSVTVNIVSGGTGIDLNSITGSLVLSSTTISGITGTGISVQGSTVAVNFGNTTLTSGAFGILLQNNTSGTRTFGTISITCPGTAAGFYNSSGGNVVAGNATINNSSSGTGSGIEISSPNADISFLATTINKLTTSGSLSVGIKITNSSSSQLANISFTSVNFGTTTNRLNGSGISITGAALNLSNYSFGTISMYTNTGTGLLASNVDGTISATGIIDITAGRAISVTGPGGLTNLNLSFTKVSSTSSTTNGITLSATSGSFTVVGDNGASSNASGGTISGTSTAGISIVNATSVSLNYMDITNSGTDGISAATLNAFTVNRCRITDNTAAATNDRGIEIGDFTTGTAVVGAINITNTSITGLSTVSGYDCFAAGIASGTSTWTVTGSTFSSAYNRGFYLELRTTANVTFTSSTCTFSNNGKGLVIMPQSSVSSSTPIVATIQNGTFTNNSLAININYGGSGTQTYTIKNNSSITGSANDAIYIASSSGNSGGIFNVRVENNQIGNGAVANSGASAGFGIEVAIFSGVTSRILINSNTIREVSYNAIRVLSQPNVISAGRIDLTIVSNTLYTTSNTYGAIQVVSSCNTTYCGNVLADIRTNTASTFAPIGDYAQFALLRNSTAVLQLYDVSPQGGTTPAAELTANNSGNTSVYTDPGVVTTTTVVLTPP